MKTNILLCILFFSFFACHTQTGDKSNEAPNHFDCNLLSSKKFVDSIAHVILEKQDNDAIWNLSEIDTTEYFTVEDYFTNTQSKNRLVLIDGEAGLSAGSADNLLILFDCSDLLKIVWAGQVGDFDETEIVDVNNDGIKEIICNSSMTWMGGCNENYRIFNFKDGKQNIVYEANSTSVIDCGLDNLNETYKQGDTLETHFDCSLEKVDAKHYAVKQIQTIKICNGGETNEDVINNVLVNTDSTTVNL